MYAKINVRCIGNIVVDDEITEDKIVLYNNEVFKIITYSYNALIVKVVSSEEHFNVNVLVHVLTEYCEILDDDIGEMMLSPPDLPQNLFPRTCTLEITRYTLFDYFATNDKSHLFFSIKKQLNRNFKH